jgi:hypothetical protein
MRLLTSPHSFCLRLSGQSIHKFLKPGTVIPGQRRFQRKAQGAFQTTFPALTPVMQIRPSSGKFTGWVYLHSISGSHNPNHLPLGQNFTAAHAGPLGYMFYTLNRFLRHLHLQVIAD